MPNKKGEEDIRYINWDFRPYSFACAYEPHTGRYLRENVFVSRWQKLMTDRAIGDVMDNAMMREDQWFVENESYRYPILEIFDGIIPSEHDTRIASNFIQFLGKGNGRFYLDEAKKLSVVFERAGPPKIRGLFGAMDVGE